MSGDPTREGFREPPTHEHNIINPDLAIVKAEVNAFYEEATANGEYPEGRYPAHLEDISDFLEQHGIDAPVMEMAVYLHDVVDHYFAGEHDDRDKGKELVERLYEKVDDENILTRALLYGVSASDWEYQVAQIGRDVAIRAIAERLNSDTSHSPERIEELTTVMRAMAGSPIEQDEDTERILIETEIDDIEFKRLDLKRLWDATRNRGSAGPVLKGGELYHNLTHKPPGNPASTFRDALETTSCWWPILKLYKHGDLGAAIEGKALEFHHRDSNGYAERQTALSTQYRGNIENIVASHSREPETTPADFMVASRVKSQGSNAKKLEDKEYEGIEFVPDGMGMRIIVPDETPAEDIRSYALELQQILSEREDVEIWHPKGIDAAFEDFIRVPKKSGYQAIHITFYYRSPDGMVPFEVQVLTAEHDFINEYGKPSHILYKTGTEFTPERQEQLKRFGLISDRVSSGSEQPETMPSAWASFMSKFPELDTPIHRVFSLHTTNLEGGEGEQSKFNRRFILGPQELEQIDFTEFFEQHPEISDLETVILPPSFIDEQSFYDLLEFIDPRLSNSIMIRQAIAMIKDAMPEDRHTGDSTLEGHLLPTALHAVIMAVSNGEHWENENPTELLEGIAVLEILHDAVEDKQLTLGEIEQSFGADMAKDVDALTSPGEEEIPDDFDRREGYAAQIINRFGDTRRKISDRLENIMTDIVELINVEMSKGASHPEKQRMLKYFAKTDMHLSQHFGELPQQYRNAHALTWYILKKLGYTPES